MQELINHITNLELLSFYGWWQFGVCLFASVALLAIWRHIGRKQGDLGQVWLAMSVMCWSVSGLVDMYYSTSFLRNWQSVLEGLPDVSDFVLSEQVSNAEINEEASSLSWNIWRSVFSLLNSLFILLALPWFRYIPKQIEGLIHSKFWIYIVGLPFVFALLPTLSHLISPNVSPLIRETDVYYSILTLIFLGMVMWSSFAKRRLPILAWLSLLCILITFVAQVYKVIGSEQEVMLFSAIFKTSLIMIFFALALSWVKELSENTIADLNQIKFKLERIQLTPTQVSHQVEMMMDQKTYQFKLTETYYNILEQFVTKKKENQQGGWLEIKPKNESRDGKTYDIQDYNQIKRLLHAILDGVYGKNQWNQELHYESLKDQLLERSEEAARLVRLRHIP